MLLIKAQLEDFASSFLSANSVSSSVDSMWLQITSELHQILDDYVPTKMSTTRFNQPWINSHLKRAARRKKKAYKKARRTNEESDWSRFKDLKKAMQKDCRSTYHSYINDMISEETDVNPKKFWSFVKSNTAGNGYIHGRRVLCMQLIVHFAIHTANSRWCFESNSFQRSHIHKISG